MDTQRRKVFYLLLMYMIGLSASEGSFEDADKSNDFLSLTHQHYDLRHTIPGEPDRDYPIYRAVPTTSFSCSQKYEGYYADMESRCQAFRICTHTTRNTAGFGFLCPNGTLFNQRYFVCDWYRNVRCEESAQFYNKNAHNHIGNNYEMMETVRQMIEYPMKTISKALSQKPVNARPYTVQSPPKLVPQPTVVSFGQSQTLPNAQRQTNYATTVLRPIMPTAAAVLREEAAQSLPIAKTTQEVYVNSFGELSTDPGTKFDENTARILAKPQNNGRALNFAESINFGLNEYFPPSNRNQKSSRNEGNLGSNLNILRHEIQAELKPKKSVHRSTSSQESTANSNFVSHGFSKAKKDYSKSRYQSSKQTPSTTKFSSSTHTETTTQETHKKISINTENHTTQTTPVTVDSFLINSLFDFPSEPLLDEIESTGVDDVEQLFFQDSAVRDDTDDIQINFVSSTEKPKDISTSEATTRTTTTTTTTTSRPVSITTMETTEATTSETTENPTVEPLALIMQLLTDNLVNNKSVKSFEEIEKENSHGDASFITKLQLKENLIDNEAEVQSTTTTTTTTTPRPETAVMQTSTEMIMSVKMVETRVRSHRRYNSSRNRAKTTTNRDLASTIITTTNRPHRRAHSRRNETITTTTNTTTATSERPTIMKERRHHHHHHHHSRHRAQTTATTITTTEAPNFELNVENEVSENDSSRKLTVRNIESTSLARGNSISIDNKQAKASVRYVSINNQRRRTTTTTSTTMKPTTITRNGQNIIRSRGSHVGSMRGRTTTTTTTKTTGQPQTTEATSVEMIVGKNIEIIPLNVSLINAIDSSKRTTTTPTTTTTTTTPLPSTSISSSSPTSSSFNTLISNTHANNTETLNNDIVETLLPFNELTRAIVDESILQNYRTSQQTQQKQQQHFNQPQPQPLVPVSPSFLTTATKTQHFATQSTTNGLTQGPNIVVARAEGQRIDATPYLQQQQPKITKVASGTSYESLNEFLNKKFGQQQMTVIKPTTNYYSTSPQQQNPYFTQQQKQSQQTHFPINVQQQQQQTKHIVYAHPSQQQQQQHYTQNNIFKNYQQQQQQLQPQITFYHNNQLSTNTQANNYRQPISQQQPTNIYRNIKLPTLNDGIIPAAYTPVAQRRFDNFNFDLETSTLPRMKLFTGVSSYDVPLSSVGRLPNDKTQRLRRH